MPRPPASPEVDPEGVLEERLWVWSPETSLLSSPDRWTPSEEDRGERGVEAIWCTYCGITEDVGGGCVSCRPMPAVERFKLSSNLPAIAAIDPALDFFVICTH